MNTVNLRDRVAARVSTVTLNATLLLAVTLGWIAIVTSKTIRGE